MTARWMRWLRIAIVAMLGSMAVAGWSVLRALEVEALPPLTQPTADGDVDRGARARRTRANIAAAVEVDPFNPARRRPDQPYRFPGEAVQAAPGASAAQRATTQLRLIGTVASVGGGGFVVCRIGSQQPEIVHVGRQIGSYTLKSVRPGRAEFTGPAGETIELTINQPTPAGR
jgi:hypothetical protein